MVRRRRRKSYLEVIFGVLTSIFSLGKLFFLGMVRFFGFFIKLNPKEISAIDKGNIAESKVNLLLNKYNKNRGAFLFHDFIIGEDQKSSQIDHLVATVNAIYVIETKNYTGEIQGDTREATWYRVTQNSENRKTKHIIEFVNPFVQNDLHIKRLEELVELSSEFDVYNVVCFNDNDDLDISGILIKSDDYVLTTTESVVHMIEQIESSYESDNEGETSNLPALSKRNKLIRFAAELDDIIITDTEEIKNHTRRLKLKQTKRSITKN
jgi:hypothetical protein